MLGLTMAWFLNAMEPGLPINTWFLTVLNFFFSLIVISMQKFLLDWELSSISASTSMRVLIEQLWRLVIGYKMRSKHTWMVCLLVQQKLARRSLSLIYMESYQLSNVFLFIFPMNTIVNFHAHQTVNEVLIALFGFLTTCSIPLSFLLQTTLPCPI